MIYSFRIGSLIKKIGSLRKISIIAGVLAALILLCLAAFTENDLDKALLQISIMLCAALILGYGARRLSQPPRPWGDTGRHNHRADRPWILPAGGSILAFSILRSFTPDSPHLCLPGTDLLRLHLRAWR
jgi:hypothetical protein